MCEQKVKNKKKNVRERKSNPCKQWAAVYVAFLAFVVEFDNYPWAPWCCIPQLHDY